MSKKVSIGRWKSRKGKLVLNYRDNGGVRQTKEFEDTPMGRLAADEESVRIRRALMAGEAPPDEHITVRQYFQTWLPIARGRLAATTMRGYNSVIQTHILPAVGDKKLIHVNRGVVKEVLSRVLDADCRDGKYSRGMVAKILATLRVMFADAVDDGTILQNPAMRLARRLNLKTHDEYPRAMTLEQAGDFLAAAKSMSPQLHLAYTIYLNTGARLGEGLGFQISDLEGRSLTVRRNLTECGVQTKTGKTANAFRTIEIPQTLVDLILATLDGRKARGVVSPWLMTTRLGLPPSLNQIIAARQVIQKGMKRVLRQAGLPEHFSVHSLRHSFAQIHMDAGTELLWISRQLGHASIKITADIYGRTRTPKNAAAAENLGRMLEESAMTADSRKVTKFAVRRSPLAIGL